MSDEIEDADDERPAAIISGQSLRATGGSSISAVQNFIKSNKDLLLGLFLGLAMLEGFFLFFAYREKQVSEDLYTYHAQQAQIQFEVDKQLLAIMNCKR